MIPIGMFCLSPTQKWYKLQLFFVPDSKMLNEVLEKASSTKLSQQVKFRQLVYLGKLAKDAAAPGGTKAVTEYTGA